MIKHDFPDHVGPWTGVYSSALFLSAAIADGLTVPLPAIDGDHQMGLAPQATTQSGRRAAITVT